MNLTNFIARPPASGYEKYTLSEHRFREKVQENSGKLVASGLVRDDADLDRAMMEYLNDNPDIQDTSSGPFVSYLKKRQATRDRSMTTTTSMALRAHGDKDPRNARALPLPESTRITSTRR